MRRSPINPVSARRRKRDSVYPAARRAVWERADGWCEASTGAACAGVGQQVHHLAGRGGPDPHRLDNLLLVCAPCHYWIEHNRAEAYELGLLVRRNTFTCRACVGREGTWCPECDGTTEA